MYDHPDFEREVEIIIRKCRENNIAVGIHFSESPNRQVKWLKTGANIVVHSSDIAIFSQKLAADIRFIRKNANEEGEISTDKIII